MNLNHFVGTGRLTRDADLRHTQGGKAVANFTLAINRKNGKGEEEATFLDCVAWESLAEIVAKYCHKGKHIGVAGELRTERWEQDGNNRSKNVLMVNRLELLGSASQAAAGDRVPSKKGAPLPPVGDDGIPF